MKESPSKTSDGTPPDSQLTPDVLFDALADQRRRYVLHCLCKYPALMALADVADEVAAREQETRLSDVPAEEVKRIYLSLYHSHIPTLADAHIVEYTQQRDLVRLSENSEQAVPFLEVATTNE